MKKDIMKLDFIKNIKKILITVGAVLFIGLLCLIIFGFNLGVDFVGCTEIKAVYGDDIFLQADYNEYSQQLSNLITEKGYKVLSTQKVGDGVDASVIVKIRNNGTNEQIETKASTLVEELKTAINVNGADYDIDYAINSAETSSSSILINSIYSLLIGILVALIYLTLRYDLLCGLTVAISMVVSVIMSLLLLAITRLPINTYNFVGCILGSLYAMILTMISINRIDNEYLVSKKTHKELVNKQMFRVLLFSFAVLLIVGILAVLSLILSLTNFTNILVFLILVVLSGAVATSFGGLYYWYYFSEYTIRKKPKIVEPEETIEKTNV